MKKRLVRTAAMVFGFAMLALGAKAQVSDQLTVNIPYAFVAAGKTLPAGTYWLARLDNSSDNELILSSVENKVGVLMLAGQWEDAGEGKPSLSFQEIGGQHFLVKIKTADHVFTVPVSKSAVLEAMKSGQGSAGGASGAN